MTLGCVRYCPASQSIAALPLMVAGGQKVDSVCWHAERPSGFRGTITPYMHLDRVNEQESFRAQNDPTLNGH